MIRPIRVRPMTASDRALDHARELVATARRVEVFTGAGISADSGLATYRDAVTGTETDFSEEVTALISARIILTEDGKVEVEQIEP